MNPQLLLFAANLINTTIALFKDSPLKDAVNATREEYQAFVKEVLEKSTKPDGTDWTNEETEAIGDMVEQVARGTIAKLSDPPPSNPEE